MILFLLLVLMSISKGVVVLICRMVVHVLILLRWVHSIVLGFLGVAAGSDFARNAWGRCCLLLLLRGFWRDDDVDGAVRLVLREEHLGLLIVLLGVCRCLLVDDDVLVMMLLVAGQLWLLVLNVDLIRLINTSQVVSVVFFLGQARAEKVRTHRRKLSMLLGL